ncbi:MAG: glycosyltransferase [Nitrospira sp.]|nr:glycosyltransferase [Nitrospira sp.]
MFLNDPTSARIFSRVEVLPDPPQPTWWGQQWHRANLAAFFETRYRQPTYYRMVRAKIEALCVEEKVDLIYADLIFMTEYVGEDRPIPAIVDLTDSITLMGARVLRSERRLSKKLSAWVHLVRARQLERSVGKVFDLVVMNSAVDEGVIKQLSASSNTLTVTNGVDMDYFSPGQSQAEADKLVFTGVMGYPPNQDAARYFSEEIFPLIRVKRPNAQFWIVGNGPSEDVRNLANRPGIHVTGEVADVRPFVRSSAVVVCPLRLGTGVKNKILIAMAMEKATVATPLSIEGLDLVDNREVALASDAQAFAHKVVHLLENPVEAQRLGANGLARVRERHSWAAMARSLETAIDSVITSRNGHSYRVN